MSYSGKQWSTQRYSIQDAKPSLSHKWVHHSCSKRHFLSTLNNSYIQIPLWPTKTKCSIVWTYNIEHLNTLTMVTRFPNHWCASSWPTTRATHCRDDAHEFFGSISRAVSLQGENHKSLKSTNKKMHKNETQHNAAHIVMVCWGLKCYQERWNINEALLNSCFQKSKRFCVFMMFYEISGL